MVTPVKAVMVTVKLRFMVADSRPCSAKADLFGQIALDDDSAA
jgi:hypothetical protein